jgi:hypothetical protein
MNNVREPESWFKDPKQAAWSSVVARPGRRTLLARPAFADLCRDFVGAEASVGSQGQGVLDYTGSKGEPC